MTNKPLTDEQLMKVGYAYADLYRSLQKQLLDYGIELVVEKDATFSVIIEKKRTRFHKASECINFILLEIAGADYH